MISRAIFALCFLFLSVSHTQAETPKKRLKVGFILPLTGITADYGVAVKNAIELAFLDHPAHREIIEPIFEDAQYDFKLAVSAFSRLKNVDNADLIFVWGLAQCKVVAPLAEQQRVPLIAQCLDTTIAAGRKYVLRYQSSVDEYMETTARWLAEHEAKKLAVVVAENPYLEEMFGGLQRRRMPEQSISVINRVPVTQMDFNAEVARMNRGDFDAIGAFLSAGQASTFTRQYAQQKGRKQLFGTNFFGSLSEIQSAKGSMEGALFSEVEIKGPWRGRYVERYRSSAQLGFAALAYEFTVNIGDLIGRRGLPSAPVDVLAWLMETGMHEGTAAGPYRYEESELEGRHVSFPLIMQRVSGDGFQPVK